MKILTAFLLCAAALSAGCDKARNDTPDSTPSSQSSAVDQTMDAATAGQPLALTTYKSATCGCCKLWVDHANKHGFNVDAQDVHDLNGVKERFEIAPEYQSCHTSVSDNNYVFEGHVPAKFIRQFLQNPPANTRGLAVPAMPLGSPGMEVGDRFTPYDILLLHKDGSHSTFARIENARQQF